MPATPIPIRYYRLYYHAIQVSRLPITYRTDEDDERRATIAEWHEDCDRAHGGTPDTIGGLYRQLRAENGRCTSRVYIDHRDGSTHAIGWVFVKREQFTDTHKHYLRETWITLSALPEPQPPPVHRAIDITRGIVL